MKESLKSLVQYLGKRRNSIVRTVAVCTEGWSPTYGASPSTEEIDMVDFDALLSEIDNFTETLK